MDDSKDDAAIAGIIARDLESALNEEFPEGIC
jgi:hypothetical protein